MRGLQTRLESWREEGVLFVTVRGLLREDGMRRLVALLVAENATDDPPTAAVVDVRRCVMTVGADVWEASARANSSQGVRFPMCGVVPPPYWDIARSYCAMMAKRGFVRAAFTDFSAARKWAQARREAAFWPTLY